MRSTGNRQKIISHFVGLNGIGGVQSNFVEYINNLDLRTSKYQHKIYTIKSIDPHYKLNNEVLNIRKISNLYRLILDIVSRDVIVHFYNNLSSLKVAFLLVLLPVRKLVIHERGTIWNQKSTSWAIPRFVAWKASVILSNSFATKTMLAKKFFIPEKKIQVLHNGIDISKGYKCRHHREKENITPFVVGFLGRLDTPKGVHVLIDAMQYLINEKVELVVAGEGILENILRQRASKSKNVRFIGRVKNPYSFMNEINLLVVPSIREPLGNVCLEAGLYKVPVLAANVDGLPEIIENEISGELIEATDKVSVDTLEGSVPLPEFVVNPVNQQLRMPKQINSYLLSRRILELSLKPEKLERYANKLHNKVINYFNINRYNTELQEIYRKLFLMR